MFVLFHVWYVYLAIDWLIGGVKMEFRGMKIEACSMHFYYGTFPCTAPFWGRGSLRMGRAQRKSGAKPTTWRRGEKAKEVGHSGWAAGKTSKLICLIADTGLCGDVDAKRLRGRTKFCLGGALTRGPWVWRPHLFFTSCHVDKCAVFSATWCTWRRPACPQKCAQSVTCWL